MNLWAKNRIHILQECEADPSLPSKSQARINEASVINYYFFESIFQCLNENAWDIQGNFIRRLEHRFLTAWQRWKMNIPGWHGRLGSRLANDNKWTCFCGASLPLRQKNRGEYTVTHVSLSDFECYEAIQSPWRWTQRVLRSLGLYGKSTGQTAQQKRRYTEWLCHEHCLPG
jgi:hypothetical protein